MIPRTSGLWTCLSLALSLFIAESASAQTYTVIDLGSLGPYDTFAFGINDATQVAGYSYVQVGGEWVTRHGFFWQDGQIQDLGAFSRQGYSWATDINEAGQICGHFGTSNDEHPFLYQNGSMQALGWTGEARGLNDFAQVVGYFQDGSNQVKACFWSQATGFQDLNGLTGGTGGLAEDINGHSQVVGWSTGSPCGGSGGLILPRATLWEKRNGTWSSIDLGALGTECSGDAFDINEAGQIVGESGFFQTTAALWQKGTSGAWTIQNLGTLGGAGGSAQAVNNRGQIVGYSQTAGNTRHAFLWQCGSMIDLNSRIPVGSGWVLTAATDINDLGEITGYGTLNGGPYRGILLKPSSTNCCGGLVVAVPDEPVPANPE